MAATTQARGINNVPERYRNGLAILLRLPDASFEELASALKRAPSFANSKELAAWVAPETKSLTPSEVTDVIESLVSLYRVFVRLEVPSEKIARDVVRSLRDSDAGLQVTDDNAASSVLRLSQLLAMESLNVIESKAQELRSEYEHEFCDARIFTDIRPVFGRNIADAPETMLLVHMLKLGYHDSHEGRHREFYVSLDGKDLAGLKAAIVRAETKANSIKSRLTSAGLKTIDLA